MTVLADTDLSWGFGEDTKNHIYIDASENGHLSLCKTKGISPIYSEAKFIEVNEHNVAEENKCAICGELNRIIYENSRGQ